MLVPYRKKKRINILPAWMLLIFLLCITGEENTVSAAEADAKFTVTVGYWGGESYTKAEKTIGELAAELGTDRQIYTWIDNDGKAGTSETEGIYISRLMDELGINKDSIYSYNFAIINAGSGTTGIKQWTPSQIFDLKYSFCNSFQKCVADDTWHLSNFFNMKETRSAASYLQTAWDEKEQVEPMFVLYKKNCVWTDGAPASSLDFSDLSDNEMPQMLFGQASVNNSGRGFSEEKVLELNIWFSGYPDVSVDSSDIKGDIGSTCKIKISVGTPDEFLTEKLSENIASQIQWSSGDGSVAKVDENGNVTFLTDGMTSITAIYNGVKYTIGVTSGTGCKIDDSGNGGDCSDSSLEDSHDSSDGDGSSEDSGEQESSDTSSESDSSTSSTSDNDNSKDFDNKKKGETDGAPKKDSKDKHVETAKNVNKDVSQKVASLKNIDENKTSVNKTTVTPTEAKDSKEQQSSTVKSANSSNALSISSGNATKIYELPQNSMALPEINTHSIFSKVIAICAVAMIIGGIIGEFVYFKRQLM